MSYFGVASWVFFAATAAALLQLRRTQPGAARPYRAPLASPVICILSSFMLIGSTLVAAPVATIAALSFICLSAPCRRLFKAYQARNSSQGGSGSSVRDAAGD